MVFPLLNSSSHLCQISGTLIDPHKSAGDRGMAEHFFRRRNVDTRLLPTGGERPAKIVQHPIVESAIAGELLDVDAPCRERLAVQVREVQGVRAARFKKRAYRVTHRDRVT